MAISILCQQQDGFGLNKTFQRKGLISVTIFADVFIFQSKAKILTF